MPGEIVFAAPREELIVNALQCCSADVVSQRVTGTADVSSANEREARNRLRV